MMLFHKPATKDLGSPKLVVFNLFPFKVLHAADSIRLARSVLPSHRMFHSSEGPVTLRQESCEESAGEGFTEGREEGCRQATAESRRDSAKDCRYDCGGVGRGSRRARCAGAARL